MKEKICNKKYDWTNNC